MYVLKASKINFEVDSWNSIITVSLLLSLSNGSEASKSHSLFIDLFSSQQPHFNFSTINYNHSNKRTVFYCQWVWIQMHS